MVKTLLVLCEIVRKPFMELAGTAMIVVGVAEYSRPAAVIVAGVAALLKAFEWELRGGGK